MFVLYTHKLNMLSNFGLNHKEIAYDDVDWVEMDVDPYQVVGCCEYGNKPMGSIKSSEFLD